MKDSVKDAMMYALRCHAETNHQYAGMLPYAVHLCSVYDFGTKYVDLLDVSHLLSGTDREVGLAACWTHDVIEDCRQSYNDVKEAVGEDVAEITYLLTTGKGRSRKERNSDKYYMAISHNYIATFVKLCDRMANAKFSRQMESSMFKKYQQENDDFVNSLVVYGGHFERFRPMVSELGDILS